MKEQKTKPSRGLIVGIASLNAWVIFGTVGYRVLEQWSWLDSFYMTVLSLSTVGFKEVHPLSDAGQVLTLVIIVGGLTSALYTFSLIGKWIVEGEIHKILGRRQMQKELNKMKDHLIVAGCGRMGGLVASMLKSEGQPVVVIDKDESIEDELINDGVVFLIGDATDEDLLRRANIDQAKSVLAMLPSDAENVYLTLTAKSLNPQIRMIARVNEEQASQNLERAGADRIIFPYQAAAMRAVNALLRPNVVEWAEMVTAQSEVPMNIEEIILQAGAELEGLSIQEANIRLRHQANLLAIRREKGEMLLNPEPSVRLESGDIMVAMGNREGLVSLAERCQAAQA